MSEPVRTAVVGCGSWGKNIVREVAASPSARLVAVADHADAGRERARALAPGAAIVRSLGDALGLGVDAVIVASPPALHAEHALQALSAGANVLVEKPLATEARSAAELVAAAARAGKVALVGHVMRHHPGIERLVELACSGALGPILYARASRLSVQRATDDSVVWALGPHDLSIWRAVGQSPIGKVDLDRVSRDVAFMRAALQNGLVCHVELSRAHAYRERRFAVIGERAVAMFDDATPEPRLLVYERPRPASVDALFGGPSPEAQEIAFAPLAPLTCELEHFFACIRGEASPRAGFDEGAEVVRALDDALARATGAAGHA